MTNFGAAPTTPQNASEVRSQGKVKATYWGLIDTEVQLVYEVASPEGVFDYDPAQADTQINNGINERTAFSSGGVQGGDPVGPFVAGDRTRQLEAGVAERDRVAARLDVVG